MEDKVRHNINLFFENRRIQDALSDLGLFAIDYAGRRSFASSLWLKCGYTAEDMNDVLFTTLLHPEDSATVTAGLDDLMEGRRDRFDGVFRMRRRDGTWIWVAASYQVIYRDEAGVPLLYVGHDQDITAIKDAEEEQRRRRQQIETLGKVAIDVNASLDLGETVSRILEHTRRVLGYDRSSVQLLDRKELRIIGCTGFDDNEAVGKLRFPYPNPGNPASMAIQSRQPRICNDLPNEFPGFGRQKGEQPTQSWMGIPLLANNEAIGLLTLDSDTPQFYQPHHLEIAVILAAHVALAVDKARMFEEARTMALTDPLTGVLNRHALRLQGLFFLDKARREQTRLCALMIDIDFFKRVNDTWGHDAGDRVLQDTAATIKACLRPYDLLFRYGGEEFLVLLPEAEVTTAEEIARRIQGCVASRQAVSGLPEVTVSIGMGSMVPSASTVLSQLIKVADLALYEAKQTGRNRVVTRLGPPVNSEPV